PRGTNTSGLTISPAKTTATPTAKLTGQILAAVLRCSASDICHFSSRSGGESGDRSRGTPPLRSGEVVERRSRLSLRVARACWLRGERGDRGLGRRRHERRAPTLAGAIDPARGGLQAHSFSSAALLFT